jgi:hypothetical protein
MARRAATLLAALSVALLVYAVLIGIAVTKIRTAGLVQSHVRCSCTSPRAYLIAGRPVQQSVPVWCWLCVGSMPFALWAAWDVHVRARRKTRERLGLCLDCGQELPRERRGRCPRCRLAYENRAAGRGAFPVLVRPKPLVLAQDTRSQNFWPVMFPSPSR